MLNKVFQIVEGAKFDALIDLQRMNAFQISKEYTQLLRILDKSSYSSTCETIDLFNISLSELEYLIQNEIFVLCNKKILRLSKPFPYSFNRPYVVENIVIELNKAHILCYDDLIRQFISLGVQAIQIRGCFSIVMEFCLMLRNTKIRDIELVLLLDETLLQHDFDNLMRQTNLISYVISPLKSELKVPRYIRHKQFDYNSFTLPYHCGLIGLKEMSINIDHYSESIMHNSCLNRKISIDAEGNIKNCPSMTESYGNIRDTTLAEAIEKPGFKKYWNINKDQIAVCKDCEFRYICTDCRAYVEDPHDTSGPDGTNLSKPLKCGYNPYTGEWAEWSTNPLKQKAIEFYGMKELIADRTKAHDL